MKQEMTGWQWYQLDHMQTICTSREITSSSSLKFYRLEAQFLTPNQQCQSSTETNVSITSINSINTMLVITDSRLHTTL